MAYNIILKALTDPTRRLVFERLNALGPCSVADLSKALPVSRPAVSQHLKALKGAGLVNDQAAGTRRIYRIEPSGLAPLRAWLDGFQAGDFGTYQAEIARQMLERKST